MLRDALVKDFDEDLVQQAILELLEAQARGQVIADPLRWCRKAIKRDRIDRGRRADIVRAGKDALEAFSIAMPTLTRGDRARERSRKWRDARRRAA